MEALTFTILHRDMEIISEELRLKDVEMVESHLEQIEKEFKRAAKDKSKQDELSFVQKLLGYLRDEKKEVRFGDWSAREIEWLNDLQLITAKPVVYLINMAEDDYFKKKSRWLAKIKQWVDSKQKDQPIIPFSGALEIKVRTCTWGAICAHSDGMSHPFLAGSFWRCLRKSKRPIWSLTRPCQPFPRSSRPDTLLCASSTSSLAAPMKSSAGPSGYVYCLSLLH